MLHLTANQHKSTNTKEELIVKHPELLIFGIDGASPAYIKDAVARGELPGFARLMKRGIFFDDCMPAFPSITPTCWSAISCGAVPSVTGALCHQVHIDGTNPTDYVTPYHSSHIHAERFWEAAARIGKKSLIIDVPSSGPAKCVGVLQVKGGVTITADACPAETYISGIPQQFFTNAGEGAKIVDSLKKRAGGAWESIEGKNTFTKISDTTYLFTAVYNDPRYRSDETEKHSWCIIAENDGVRIGTDENNAMNSPLIHEYEWSDVITRRLLTDNGERVPFHFRARLDRFDKSTKTFTLFITGCENLCRDITPISLAREIAEIPETYAIDYSSIYKDPCITDKFFDGVRQSSRWHQAVISHCMENYQPDIIFDFSGNIDTLNHRFRSAYEKVLINYDGEYECAKDAMQKGYEAIDEHICWLLDNVADDSTTILLVSDHGSIGRSEATNPWSMLEKAGLMVYKDNNSDRHWKNPHIDWTKTRAYPIGSCYINVNLKGREPCGAVDECDYVKTVTEIIRALQTYGYSKDGGVPSLAFAVEKKQAGFIGHGGKNCGDVVYGLAGGTVGGFIGGVHSQQIPSARSETGDIRSLCLISGPEFKKGAILSRPSDLTDIAPTVCYALSYPQPRDATGGIIFQAFEKQDCYKK